MRNLLLYLFLAVSSFSIYDTADYKKVILAIDYDNGFTDKILMDRSALEDRSNVWKIIEQILNERKAQ